MIVQKYKRITPIMRTALAAGLVAGSVLFCSGASAGEGSSLRGLKAPLEAWERLAAAERTRAGEGLKQPAPATAFELAPRISFYEGTLDSRSAVSNTTQLRSGLYRPLGRSSALAEGIANPLHDSIPKYTLYSQVSQPLGGGFGVGFGMRRSEYNFSGTSLLAFSAEQTLGSFRGAYTLYSTRTDFNGGGPAHRFQLSYAYGDRNTVGLSYTTGREIDNQHTPLGAPFGASLSEARDWSLSGRHWISTNWALTYDVQAQDSGYRRQGLRLGVSRSF